MTPQVDPIIIIGAARSGTKFLRQLLAASAEVAVIPYDVGYVWRYGNEALPDDTIALDAWRPEIGEYIRNFVLRAGSGHRFVVEKTVANSVRVDFAARVFPEARFIHLIRDGRDVAESAFRQWQTPPDWKYILRKARQFPYRNFRYAAWYARNVISGLVTRGSGARVWGPRYPGIDKDLRELPLIEVCAKQWVESVERSVAAFENMAQERWTTLRYEDLVAESGELKRICEFIGIGDIDSVIAAWRATVSTDAKGKWTSGLGETEQQIMLPVVGPTLSGLGYDETFGRHRR